MDASERQEQLTVMDWMRLQNPWLVNHTIYIMNERRASLHAGKLMNRMGRLAGASDLFIAYPTSKYYGLFLELKTKTGRASPKQLEFIERMNKIGFYAVVAHGADEAIDIIKRYLINEI